MPDILVSIGFVMLAGGGPGAAVRLPHGNCEHFCSAIDTGLIMNREYRT